MKNSIRVSIFVCLLVAALIWAQQPSRAQAGLGSLCGVVVDASGAVIPDAEVTAKHLTTGKQFKAKTDARGYFLFSRLPLGSYDVAVVVTGFVTAHASAEVKATTGPDLKITLQVGSVEGTVTVSASVSLLSSAAAMVAGGAEFNTEEYGLIRENGFFKVSRRPLSTFSIDVDTASYSNMRRFLDEGEMPPADAVRIEELINYFHYDYPEPNGGEPFSVSAEMMHCPWQPKHRLVHIGLKSKSIPVSNLPPNNLVFLIDVSGSMDDDNKLPLVVKAFRLLVEQLRPQDSVSIVVYAGAAGRVLAPTSGSRKDTILSALDVLEAGGSTAGAQGILLAYQTARESFIHGENNRVILATDGDFNVGVSSDGELVKLIEEAREAGLSLSVLDFGVGNLKDSKMEQLADHGNGNYAYIDDLLEARRMFVEQAGATLLTVAKDVNCKSSSILCTCRPIA